MTYFIDAWLDRPQPYLRIINRLTGHTCLQIEGNELEKLREQGILDIQDLSSPEPSHIKEQIRQLFLFCRGQAAQRTTQQ
ncbi:PA4570 family protein [Thiopseudomonas acetoxidans]|uniref:Uncharacterized protein n=1 Tax=Thiopseudomonas acetoxidans TaxID=3041622 RepID=A0ABT7SRH8_9GAMM|nr:hypothetical protein [Thiopseudomonas sp. CY1220]MDM7858589.1 hypothetical protein [Thiopseudomonas sp. CY1220]NLC10521.1 hypothetical protein [Gammaproteobacteria bacterium]